MVAPIPALIVRVKNWSWRGSRALFMNPSFGGAAENLEVVRVKADPEHQIEPVAKVALTKRGKRFIDNASGNG
jgi:hypothetical protein